MQLAVVGAQKKRFKAEPPPSVCPDFGGLSRTPLMAAPIPVTQVSLVRATEGDAGRSGMPLAHHMAQHLRLELLKEQRDKGTQRVDLGPFALGCWVSFLQLRTARILRLDSGFPITCAWLDAMAEQTTQLIGQCCLHEPLGSPLGLTVDDRAAAASCRSLVIVEMNGFPTWVEARIDQLSPSFRHMIAKILNATSELFWEMGKVIPDQAILQVAERTAEAVLRCSFKRSVNSQVPTTPMPHTARPSSASGDRMVRYGLAPYPDPNLALSAAAVSTPAAASPPDAHPRDADMGRAGDESSDEIVIPDD